MSAFIDFASLPISVVALLVSIASFTASRRDLNASRRQEANRHLTDAEEDIKSVLARVPELKTYWRSAFALRGVAQSSMSKLKNDECDSLSSDASALRSELEGLPGQVQDLKGADLSKRIDELYAIKVKANATAKEVQRSWEQCLSEIEQARQK